VREAPTALDAAVLRAWCLAGEAALAAARKDLDALNVYPVADSDTGTNLHLTMRAVADALRVDESGDLAAVAQAVARAALMGARGNSGVILSQLVRGFTEVVAEAAPHGDRLDGRMLATALVRGAETARNAVSNPVDGTILSVARDAGAAAQAVADRDVTTVASAAADGAAEALARTPQELPVLAEAGVVDAGGKGLLVLLDALVEVLTGSAPARASAPAPVVDRARLRNVREQGSDEFAFEVMYLLEAPDSAMPVLTETLERLGDSVVLAGGRGLWNVHVHVNDVGAAIEAGIVAGRPYRIEVTHFATQIAASGSAPLRGRAVIAMCPGAGLARLYSDAGAQPLDGYPAVALTSQAVLEAIRETHCAEVVLLPNVQSAQGVAEAAAEIARTEGLTVSVVPSRASVQGLAALAVHDPARGFDDDVIAMTAAARATRFAEVTLAQEDALTSAGVCKAGDVLGFLDGDVAVIGDDVFLVACGLLDRLLIGGGELVTIVSGIDADKDLTDRVNDYLRAARPDVEVVVYAGEQPQYPILIGVE
jgi:fatty acid kinase